MKLLFLKKVMCTLVIFSVVFSGFLPAAAEAPEQTRYVAVGDSLTFGLGATEVNYLRINAFVPRFVRFLRTEDVVHVENYGIPGLTAEALVSLLENDQALAGRLADANLITISIGGNDLLNIIKTNPAATENDFNRALNELLSHIQELDQLLNNINSRATTIYVGLYNPYPPDHPYYQIAETFVGRYNQALIDQVQNSHTAVANPAPSFKNKSKQLTRILEEDIHPNDEGYSKIYEAVKVAYAKINGDGSSVSNSTNHQ